MKRMTTRREPCRQRIYIEEVFELCIEPSAGAVAAHDVVIVVVISCQDFMTSGLVFFSDISSTWYITGR